MLNIRGTYFEVWIAFSPGSFTSFSLTNIGTMDSEVRDLMSNFTS